MSSTKIGAPNRPSRIAILGGDADFSIELATLLRGFPDQFEVALAQPADDAFQSLGGEDFDLVICKMGALRGNVDAIRLSCAFAVAIDTTLPPMTLSNLEDELVSLGGSAVALLPLPLSPFTPHQVRMAVAAGHMRLKRDQDVARATTSLGLDRLEATRGLHDEIGAQLAQLQWRLTSLDTIVESGNGVPEIVRASLLNEIAGCRQFMGEASRVISNYLSGAEVEPVNIMGLRLAIDGLISQWTAAAPAVQFEYALSDVVDRFDGARAGSVYRIIQEALTNAMRHADPSYVFVKLFELKEKFRIEVTSIGRIQPGLNSDGPESIRHRCATLGGALVFDFDADQGVSSLIVTAPL